MLKRNLLAQFTPNGAGPEPTGIYNPALSKLIGRGKGIDIINLLLGNIISFIFILGIIITFFFIIIGGIQWATAGGDKEKISSARGRVISAIVGLVVLFLVFAIMKLIGTFFGIEQLKLLFFDISPYIIIE